MIGDYNYMAKEQHTSSLGEASVFAATLCEAGGVNLLPARSSPHRIPKRRQPAPQACLVLGELPSRNKEILGQNKTTVNVLLHFLDCYVPGILGTATRKLYDMCQPGVQMNICDRNLVPCVEIGISNPLHRLASYLEHRDQSSHCSPSSAPRVPQLPMFASQEQNNLRHGSRRQQQKLEGGPRSRASSHSKTHSFFRTSGWSRSHCRKDVLLWLLA